MANMNPMDCALGANNIRTCETEVSSQLICVFGAEVKSFLKIRMILIFEDGSLRFFDGF